MQLAKLVTFEYMKYHRKKRYDPDYFTRIKDTGQWIIEVCPQCGVKGVRWNNGKISKSHVCLSCGESYV